jgi:hypothetical protein
MWVRKEHATSAKRLYPCTSTWSLLNGDAEKEVCLYGRSDWSDIFSFQHSDWPTNVPTRDRCFFFFFLPPSLGYEMKLLLIWDKSRGKRVKPIQQVGDLYLYFIEGVKETGNRSLTSWKLAASSTHKTLVSTSSTIHRKSDTKVQQVPPPCLAQRLYAGDLWRRGEWATGGGNGSALKTPTRRVGPLFLHRPECFFLC